jgi:hypothetical protein
LVTNQLFIGPQYTPTGTAGGFDYFDITGVQLEKGTVATPFEVRPFATELALCQRYYKRIDNGQNSTATYIGSGTAYLSTIFLTGVTHNIEMRANPTVSSNLSAAAATSNAYLYTSLTYGGALVTCNATSVYSFYGTGRASYIQFNSTGLTPGSSGTLILANTGNQYIDFNAEL